MLDLKISVSTVVIIRAPSVQRALSVKKDGLWYSNYRIREDAEKTKCYRFFALVCHI